MLAKLAEGQEPEEGAGYGDGEDSEGDGKTPEQVQDAQVPDAYSEGDAEKYKKAGTGAREASAWARPRAPQSSCLSVSWTPGRLPTLVIKRVDPRPGVAAQPGKSRR